MKNTQALLAKRLQQRIENNSYRTLKPSSGLIDFCSNDYLGFARSEELKKLFQTKLSHYPDYKLGSTGSRLLAGNDLFTEELEAEIALFHQAESALLFNSGYDANLGLFSSLAQRGDTLICDELIHASIIDGARLSFANRYNFKHNDLSSLEEKLRHASQTKGQVFIAVESIYSMDGDEAPLKEICGLASRFNSAILVDEAHATGIFGHQGRGLVHELNLQDQVFARLITFGKGLGSHGAAVLGSHTLRSYLVNFARSFIYTTAAPFSSHLTTKIAYRFLQSQDHQRALMERIKCFRDILQDKPQLLYSRSAIQAILIPGNREAKQAATELEKAGFDVRAILSPTVKTGSERLRICLHNHNSIEEVEQLATQLKSIL
ncbi:MAG TPA: 8-amino-7-oxononanoate synthase [Daejeonella sp.]|nr:8-amino-7-oxononanoate synthase [Daejeonella sp.]